MAHRLWVQVKPFIKKTFGTNPYPWYHRNKSWFISVLGIIEPHVTVHTSTYLSCACTRRYFPYPVGEWHARDHVWQSVGYDFSQFWMVRCTDYSKVLKPISQLNFTDRALWWAADAFCVLRFDSRSVWNFHADVTLTHKLHN